MPDIRLPQPIPFTTVKEEYFGISTGTPKEIDALGATTYVVIHRGFIPPRIFLQALKDSSHTLFNKRTLDELLAIYMPVHERLLAQGEICTQQISIQDLRGFSYKEQKPLTLVSAISELYLQL